MRPGTPPELSVTSPFFHVCVSSSSHLPGLHLPLCCISFLYCLVIVCVSSVRLTYLLCQGLPPIIFSFLFSIQIPERVGSAWPRSSFFSPSTSWVAGKRLGRAPFPGLVCNSQREVWSLAINKTRLSLT